MRLEAFLLADAATATPDGKLYIHGGGITRLTAAVLPLVSQLALVVRLAVDVDDFKQEHTFSFSLADPDGGIVVPPVPLKVAAQEPPKLPEGEERFLQLAIGLGPVTFSRAGLYRLKLTVNNRTLRSMNLPVVAMSSDELERIMSPFAAPAQKPPAAKRPRRTAKKSRGPR